MEVDLADREVGAIKTVINNGLWSINRGPTR